ncbi:MAG: hypothetical protein JWM85_3289 [Acidimicrobiaceae bacterium]|nr:hypothetical protein [Acidimicrobiaceae bacterium]
MIALLVVVVFLGAALAIALARFAGAKAERRSVASYEHALDVLGDVAKRSDAVAPVHAPRDDELGRPHVGPASIKLSQPMQRPRLAPETVSPPRAPLQPIEPPRPPRGPLPIFGDADLLGDAEASKGPGSRRSPLSRTRRPEPQPEPDVTAPIALSEPVVSFDAIDGEEFGETKLNEPVVAADFPVDSITDDSARPGRAHRRPGERRPAGQDRSVRRAATGAAAAMALGALAVGGWQLARGHAPSSPLAAQGPKNVAGGSASPPPVQTPTALEPTSVTKSLVTYSAPGQAFTVTFTAQTPCWVGAQKTQNASGPWDWMAEPGMSNGPVTATYHATGPVVIRLGAPKAVQVTVNGLPVALPAGNVQPYDIAFVGSGSIAA